MFRLCEQISAQLQIIGNVFQASNKMINQSDSRNLQPNSKDEKKKAYQKRNTFTHVCAFQDDIIILHANTMPCHASTIVWVAHTNCYSYNVKKIDCLSAANKWNECYKGLQKYGKDTKNNHFKKNNTSLF